MTKKEKQRTILEQIKGRYQLKENSISEFTWDGPANWELWEASNPKILFLVKEARKGFHPSIPGQGTESKFARNIARWKMSIKSALLENKLSEFPSNDIIPLTNDDICIVEVKKINEEKNFSKNKEILKYAIRDKELLKQQIQIINPEIVVCCSTFYCYTEIFEVENRSKQLLSSIENFNCWTFGDQIVVNFNHPSTWQAWIDPNKKDKKLFEILCRLMNEEKVQFQYLRNNK